MIPTASSSSPYTGGIRRKKRKEDPKEEDPKEEDPKEGNPKEGEPKEEASSQKHP